MSEPRWLDSDEQAAWRSLLRAYVRLVDRLDRELDDAYGIGLDDYEVLVHISESPDGQLRMSDLADQLLHSRSRLTYRVGRLEKAGIVERSPCDDDGRGTFARLTEQGRALLEDAAPLHVEGVRRHLIDPMGTEAFLAVGNHLGRVAEQLDQG